ncbi:DMT family transporter [Vagococcus fluvialis]|uniref:EamA family transporter n=1 Tax=Vagococcus fluvialis TaxID=2738 RepID=A0A369B615_9ENTE|nr:DMT family transporter [Vagococcus fluvialis]MDT2746614.1 DMT family transporter [Vagococcus fluvialis]RCX15124.1 EamA-like transporter family protein [Vagococcus fluvialis]RSU05593.1 EamA family transporter [Vagococcus fluvialis]UDM74794.1 DMT family transporter [Vagococcus fluvialis]WNF89999.1 DMT family transporter [Vagococcus fluvialis]
MNSYIGKIGLMLVAIIWGTGFVASALALENYSAYQILAIRFTIAFLVLLVLNIKRLKALSAKTIKRGSLLGVFLFLAFAFQTVGLQFTTPSKNAFLTAVNVVIVPFLGYLLLKKKLSVKSIVGSFVTLIGIALLSLTGSVGSFNLGDILTLICAVFFALQIFVTDLFVNEEETWSLMLLQMGSAAILSWITLFVTGDTLPVLEFKSLMPVLYLGLVSTLLAYFIQTASQKYTTSSQAAIILSTEAFFGMISSVIILSERVSINMLVGAVFIFIGILIVELEFKLLVKGRS